MSHWHTPEREAEQALLDSDWRDATPEGVVETVLDTIAQPDVHMLVAGADEIAAAFPNQVLSKQFRVDLAGKIWRAMFERVRR
jgi:hypothetical protein